MSEKRLLLSQNNNNTQQKDCVLNQSELCKCLLTHFWVIKITFQDDQKQGTQSRCSGTTQRGGMGRAVGGGSECGDTCTCGSRMLMYGETHHNIVK